LTTVTVKLVSKKVCAAVRRVTTLEDTEALFTATEGDMVYLANHIPALAQLVIEEFIASENFNSTLSSFVITASTSEG